MPRTTSELVGGIIEVDATISLVPFIEISNALVTEKLGDLFDDTRLELIERWLAAHFYTNRDPRAVSERAGPVSQTLQSAVALHLNSSHYGQTAMLLDTSGTLKRLSEGKALVTGGATWLGTEDE